MIDIGSETGPLRIVLGAGPYERPGWIRTQQEDLDLLRPEDWRESFGERRVDAILAEHVWEHLDAREAVRAARLCYEFLKPGGYIRCAVPDGLFPDPEYQRVARIGGPGSPDHPAASHKSLFSYRTLPDVFTSAGFEVRLLEYFDEAGRFHFTKWNPADGFVYRSMRFDRRNRDGNLAFASLLLDAVKPAIISSL